ncbi:hypothetical protein [Paraburkholderia dilworthii]|uniref:Uncharacterized protein n=1 Tax=Paraburkholderia dilworthii TaxID=948106 RepID=A0ABW9D958_9BURK
MKRIEGRLTLLGNGTTVQQDWTRRSVVEIDGQEYRNLHYSPYLSTYFERVGQPVAIGVQSFLGRRSIFAVATADGRVRRESMGWLLAILAVYALPLAYCAAHLPFDGASSGWWVGVGLMGWLSLKPIRTMFALRSFKPLSNDAATHTEDNRQAA